MRPSDYEKFSILNNLITPYRGDKGDNPGKNLKLLINYKI